MTHGVKRVTKEDGGPGQAGLETWARGQDATAGNANLHPGHFVRHWWPQLCTFGNSSRTGTVEFRS